MLKSTQFGQKLCVFKGKWYTDERLHVPKIGTEMVKISKSGRHIHIQFVFEEPTPGLTNPCKSSYI